MGAALAALALAALALAALALSVGGDSGATDMAPDQLR